MQIVSRGENASLRARSRSLWPSESTLRLDGLVNQRCMTSLGRPGPLCAWTTQAVHKIIDVFTDDRVDSATRQHKELKTQLTFISTTDFSLRLDVRRNFRSLRSKLCVWRNMAAASLERARLILSKAGLPFGSLPTFWSCSTLRIKNPIDILGFGTSLATLSFLLSCCWDHSMFL